MVAKIFNHMNNVDCIEGTEITANILINGYSRVRKLDECFEVSVVSTNYYKRISS